jgi:hypothetical protein
VAAAMALLASGLDLVGLRVGRVVLAIWDNEQFPAEDNEQCPAEDVG